MMKRKNTLNKILNYGIALFIIVASACNKDRLLHDDYAPLDSFYNNNKQEEQVFVIDSTGGGPIIGKMGTKIYVDTSIFMHHDSTGITFPYEIHLVELYPVKDMILWQMPTIAGGNILESAAEIRVRAFKSGEELLLKPAKKYTMILDTMTSTVSGMQVYYGFDASGYVDWTNNIASVLNVATDTLSSVVNLPNNYVMNVALMGWTNCGRLHTSSAGTTTITVTAQGTNTQNIGVFIVFRNFKSVMQVYNFTSGQIPIGEDVTLIAFAINQNGDYVMHRQDITLSSAQIIPLVLNTTTEADLLSTLDGL